MSPRLRVFPDPASLARAAASALAAALAEAIAMQGRAHLGLTGGSMGQALVGALAATDDPLVGLDLARVDVWWSDERFLPLGDPDRNDTQALAAGLGTGRLAAIRRHHAPDPDAYADDLVAAAAAYERELASTPRIDLSILGVGPDGHVASLFPGHPAAAVDRRGVVGVTDSPKPPPRRVSWTMPTLCGADRAWLLATGSEKAGALATAWAQAGEDDHAEPPGPTALPAARVRGRRETTWWLDEAAAALIDA